MKTKEEIDKKYIKKLRNIFIAGSLIMGSMIGAELYNEYKTLNEMHNLSSRPIYQEHYVAEQKLSRLKYEAGKNFIPTAGYVPLKADTLKLNSVFSEEIKKKKTLDSLIILTEKRIQKIEEDTNYQEYSKELYRVTNGPLIRLLVVLGITGIGSYLLIGKYDKARKEEYRFAGIQQEADSKS